MVDFGNYLARHTNINNRWHLLSKFIQDWGIPTASASPVSQKDIEDIESQLEFKLPAALREWYLFSFQPYYLLKKPITWNYMIPVTELKHEEGFIPIFVEYEGVFEWSISALNSDIDDPPVYMRTLPYLDYSRDFPKYVDASEPVITSKKFSEFVVQMIILETLYVKGYYANGVSDISVLKFIEEKFAKIGFPDWHFPADLTLFYGDADTILTVRIRTRINKGVEINVGTRSLEALQKIIEILSTVDWLTINTTGKFERNW